MILLFLIFIFLVLRFTVTLFNFISNPKLPVSGRHYTDLISILIPTSGRSQSLLYLLRSIQAQDYENYEVLILSDALKGDIVCENFCNTHEKFKVIRAEEVPDGWARRTFACHQLAQSARGNYFIFLDANDKVNKGLFNNAVHRMKQGQLSLLSLFANHEMRSWGEKLVVPLIHHLLLNLLPLRLVRLSSSSSFAAASGQFMMFENENYRGYQWHKEVRNKVAEDVEIMRLVKAYGLHGEALLANGFLSCRLYRNFRDALNGFSKTILSGFGNSVPGILLYVFLVIIGPVAVSFYLGLELLLFAVTLVVLSRIMISFSAGQNPWVNIFLHPFQMVSLLFVAVLSIQRHYTRNSSWKNRSITDG